MMSMVPNPICPACSSVEVDANAWEAWCFDCDGHWTFDDDREVYGLIRESVLIRREWMAEHVFKGV